MAALSFFVYTFIGASLLAVTLANNRVRVGDISVRPRRSTWKCDRIYCPAYTYRCYVKKCKSHRYATILTRINICYDKEDNILMSEVTEEPIDANTDVNVDVNSYRHSSSAKSAFIGNKADADEYDLPSYPIHHVKKMIRNIEKKVQANLIT